jgi:hypothetical protein
MKKLRRAVMRVKPFILEMNSSLLFIIIVSMVQKFGSQLIRELRNLKERTEMLTSLDPSIGSPRVVLPKLTLPLSFNSGNYSRGVSRRTLE